MNVIFMSILFYQISVFLYTQLVKLSQLINNCFLIKNLICIADNELRCSGITSVHYFTGVGISIVSGRVEGPKGLSGIFIKNVVSESPAGLTGQLFTGDQIIEVGGIPLKNSDQAKNGKHNLNQFKKICIAYSQYPEYQVQYLYLKTQIINVHCTYAVYLMNKILIEIVSLQAMSQNNFDFKGLNRPHFK